MRWAGKEEERERDRERQEGRMWGSFCFKNSLCFAHKWLIITKYIAVLFHKTHISCVLSDIPLFSLFMQKSCFKKKLTWLCDLHAVSLSLAGMNKLRNKWLKCNALLYQVWGVSLIVSNTHTHNWQRGGVWWERDTGPTTFSDWQQSSSVLLSLNGNWSENRGTRAKHD